jgi:hypothetical protein
LALYDLARGEYTVDSNGVPIVHVSYEFVGNKPICNASPTSRVAASLLRMTGLHWFITSPGRLRKWLAAWMMAPIEYPMSTRDAPSAASDQPTEES